MYNFTKQIYVFTADNELKEAQDPVHWGYGLKSYISVYKKFGNNFLINADNFFVNIGQYLDNIQPYSVIHTHDVVFDNIRNYLNAFSSKNILWIHSAHIDLQNKYVMPPQTPIPPIIEQGLLFADYIVVYSEMMRQYIIENYSKYITGDTLSKIVKMNLYVDNGIFHEITNKEDDKINLKQKVLKEIGLEEIDVDKKIVLWVGRSDMLQKNVILFDSVADKFYKDGLRDYIFIKVGGGDKISGYRNLYHIGKLKQQQLNKLYNISDILVNTSFFEPFGLGIVEYIMSGGRQIVIPITSGFYSDNKQFLEEYNYFDPFSKNAKLDLIERILASPELQITTPIVKKYNNLEEHFNALQTLYTLPQKNINNYDKSFEELYINQNIINPEFTKITDNLQLYYTKLIELLNNPNNLENTIELSGYFLHYWNNIVNLILLKQPKAFKLKVELITGIHRDQFVNVYQKLVDFYKPVSFTTDTFEITQDSMIIEIEFVRRDF